MRLELHILQNFAPSNLNRDDTGSPKDCEFGGVRRARISSQALKRAARWDSRFREAIEQHGAVRTRRLAAEVANRLDAPGAATAATLNLVAEVFTAGGLEVPLKKGKEKKATDQKADDKKASVDEDAGDNTKVLVFADEAAIDRIVAVFRENLVALRDKKSDAQAKAIAQVAEILVDSAQVPDIALFGRMLEVGDNTPFGRKNLRVDAAVQVAHALSTNRVSMEFDYFTAVDDLNPTGITGAGMIGTVEFNSACFYRYANLDIDQLRENLAGKDGLAQKTVKGFLESTIHAIPTGKQNSMAAQNLPCLVFAVVRQGGPWSLANAFLRPVRPETGNLEEMSAKELAAYWSKLSAMYGADDVRGAFVATYVDPEFTPGLEGYRVANVARLVEGVLEAAG